ncbi:ABC transporter ATP-binding protein [Microbacter margulisiae]|uniref:ABC-2 type transport system ATP-binding protein n=1 Tax=Microbacter margulisiae TaxID=1350067 RepID=A0A7W5H1X5_9PORP|nr:ABC transporter ATP-binding protein [Microbacter margulisiae]MBB3186846.1 ABC-2 type transport system ATP-binding protein [Microbacter margulisiae]
MPFIEIQQVTKQYNHHLALDHVNLSIQRNAIYGLLGPNGAGKTTLIRIINQITAPDEGTILLEGFPMKASDIQRIGYMPEERGLYKKMKVGEQALYLAQLKGLSKTEATKRLKEWFERLEMTSWWDKKVQELSKGMQQKVQFIATVMHNPDLLIFDEPFSGFDPVNADIMKREMIRLRNEGATIIFSTHNMESVEELCDNITLINRSKVVLQGNVHEIKQQFKTNIYRIILDGIVDSPTPFGKFKMLDQNIVNNHTLLRIETVSSSANEIITALLPYYTLLSFEEEIPNLNDIFIQIVKGQPSVI